MCVCPHRLSEGNVQSIATQLERMYAENSRNGETIVRTTTPTAPFELTLVCVWVCGCVCVGCGVCVGCVVCV